MKKSIVTFVLAMTTLVVSAAVEPTTSTSKNSASKELVLKSELNPFCKAIVLGKIDLVKEMIALGEDVNEKSLGKTPAMYAARFNKTAILELLINEGADLSLKSDKEKFTAEKFAELSNAKEALAILEEQD